MVGSRNPKLSSLVFSDFSRELSIEDVEIGSCLKYIKMRP